MSLELFHPKCTRSNTVYVNALVHPCAHQSSQLPWHACQQNRQACFRDTRASPSNPLMAGQVMAIRLDSYDKALPQLSQSMFATARIAIENTLDAIFSQGGQVDKLEADTDD